MSLEDIIIEENAKREKLITQDALGLEKKQRFRTGLADVISNLTYSIVFGTTADYLSGLRSLTAFAVSRGINMTVAGTTAKTYGKWREYVYKRTNTTQHSSGLVKKFCAEMVTFNTFNVPSYGAAIFTAYIISKISIEPETIHHAWTYLNYGLMDAKTALMYTISKIHIASGTLHDAWHLAKDGMIITWKFSPFTSTSYGWYNNFIRKKLGVETPGEKVEDLLNQNLSSSASTAAYTSSTHSSSSTTT